MKIIKDNLNIYVEETKKYKNFYLCICLHQPLDIKTVTKNRLIPLVLEYSCNQYRTQKILNSALAKANGAELSVQSVKKGDRLIMQFLITAPTGNEERCFELLNHIINKPYITADNEFAVSRKQYLEEIIKNKSADSKNYAMDKCLELMFDNKGFGIDGDGYLDMLESAENGLFKHYMDVYNNSQADVFVIGNIHSYKVVELVRKYFPNLSTKEIETQKADIKMDICKTDNMDMSQAKLCIGLKTDNSDRFEKLVYNEIFGGSGNSMLFNVIREQNNLCYYVNSRYFSLPDIMLVQAGIQKEKFEDVVELIKKQLSFKPEKNEIEVAKSTLINNLKALSDYPLGLMDFYLTQNIFDDSTTLDQAIINISKVEKINVKPEISTIYMLG